MPSVPGRPYPKLRTRQQITLRYRQLQAERDTWRALRDRVTQLHADRNTIPAPRVLDRIERYITECDSKLDELLYVLNGVV